MKNILFRSLGILLNTTAHVSSTWNGNLAFTLLCKVQRTPLRAQAKAFFDTARTTYLPLSSNAVALHSWGTGTKHILFVHGWQSNASQWKPYLAQFNLNNYTIHALDAPAHGLSSGNHLNVELFREAISTAVHHIGSVDTMVHHSLGSLAGSYALLHDPDLPVSKFIIMGAPSGMDAIFGYFQERLNLSQKTLRNLHIKISKIVKIPIEDLQLKTFFAKANKPILVIHESSDTITPIAPIAKALQEYPHIKTHFMTGQDHRLREQPTIFAVKSFIQN